jgi:hypothetical protein
MAATLLEARKVEHGGGDVITCDPLAFAPETQFNDPL